MEFQSKNIALQRGSTTTAINNYSSGGSGLVSAPLNYLSLVAQSTNLAGANGIIKLPAANYLLTDNGWNFSAVNEDGTFSDLMTLDINGNLSVKGDVIAFGSTSGGTSTGGLIQSVFGYSNLGSSFDNSTLTDTFNAYTINQMNNRLINVENGALTQISSALVTNALGFTPYNSTNPSGYISGITSGMVTTALGYTPLPTRAFGSAVDNNTGDFLAYNGTAVNSTSWGSLENAFGAGVLTTNSITSILAVHTNGYAYKWNANAIQGFLGLGSSAYTNTNDHILNQNSSAQSANMWISGIGNFNGIKINSTEYISLDIPVPDNIIRQIRFTSPTKECISWTRAAEGDKALEVFREPINGYSALQLFNLNTSGAATFASTVNATQFQSTVATGTAPLTVNSTTLVSNLNAQYLGSALPDNSNVTSLYNNSKLNYNILSANAPGIFPVTDNANAILSISRLSYSDYNTQLGFNSNNDIYINSTAAGVNFGWKKLYHSGNLTNNLSTNYLPKWNGSSFVNSLISDDGLDNAYCYVGDSEKGGINFKRSGGSVYGKVGIEQFGVNNDTYIGSFSNNGFGLYSTGNKRLYIRNTGEVDIYSTTLSTSPTTGALVVNGGVGVREIINTNYLSTYYSGSPILMLGSDYSIYGGVGTNVGLYVYGNNQLDFSTNSGKRLSIYGGGNVGIGYTTDQGYKLAVNGSGYFGGNVTASGFISYGNITAAGEITAYSSSDIRLKENIQPLNKSLELINKLNPVSYNWNNKAKELNPTKTNKTDVGVIAQQLKEILPNLVHNIYNDEFLAVDYVKLIPYLIGAIQELTQEINTLKNNK